MTAKPLVLEVQARRRLPGFELQVAFTSDQARTVLFGPSGGGKSMTLRAIAGAVRLHSGRIAVAGRLLYDSEADVNLPAYERRVGYVPQGYGLFPHLDVAGNILFGMKAERAAREAALRRLLELTELTGMERRRVSELSGGQQQRVALARALATEPSLLLLDEPFSALDAARRRGLRDEVIKLQRLTGVPLVTVTHDLQDAFELGDRIVIIDSGRVLQQGPREEVFYRPASRRAAELVGLRNLLPARVLSQAEGVTVCDWQGIPLQAETPRTLAPGSSVTLAVRPSQVMIARLEQPYAARPNVIACHIEEEVVTPEGYRLLVTPRAAHDSMLEIELSGYTYFRLGLDTRKDIDVSVRPDALHVIVEDASAAE